MLFLSLSAGVVHHDDAMEAIQGSWLQIYSNRYVQSTSEIDYQCVRAEISPVLDANSTIPTVSLTKKAYQHGNFLLPVEWTQTYSLTLQNEAPESLQDNLLLQPITNSSSVVVALWLRRISPHFIVWSGLDNKTMLVWSRESLLDPVDNVLVLQELVELDFNDTYKSPVVSYSLACF